MNEGAPLIDGTVQQSLGHRANHIWKIDMGT